MLDLPWEGLLEGGVVLPFLAAVLRYAALPGFERQARPIGSRVSG